MLDKATLKTQIKQAFKDQTAKKDDPDAALDDLADKLATAVDAYVKSLTIVYSAGLIAPPTGGPVTGVLTHTVT